MKSFKRERGFLTFAQNGSADYLRMAYALALSLKTSQSDVTHLSVAVTPGTIIPSKYKKVFDEIIDIPWLDEAVNSDWKLENEWKAYHITPYKETIKLDADMLFPKDIKTWWPILEQNDVFACKNAVTFRDEKITSDYYRKVFTSSKLDNVYSAFFYFKYCDFAEELFKLIEIIYHNWEYFFFHYLEEPRPKIVSTDVVFALAMKLFDSSYSQIDSDVIRIVHMKSRLQNWPVDVSENWTEYTSVILRNDLNLKIGMTEQYLPFHYYWKDFLTNDIISKYEKVLGI